MEIRKLDVETLGRPLEINAGRRGFVAPNRIVYQPMEGNDAEPDGSPGELAFRRYSERASGRPGIEIVEALAVTPGGRARENQLLINDATALALEKLVKEYRLASPETIILFQLTHSGVYSREPLAPHPVEGRDARLLTDREAVTISDAYVKAVRLARECGADGIDFKHCHGYLCGSLLRPANVKRPGWSYGGETIEERSRFFIETMDAMKTIAPAEEFLYSLRISAYEGLRGGFGSLHAKTDEPDPELKELKAFCSMAREAGVALFNQSAGVPEATPGLVRQTSDNLADFARHERCARAIRDAADAPVIGSGYSCLGRGVEIDGRERNFIATAAENIRAGNTDFAGVGRQTFADPGFALKILSGDIERIKWCVLCNRCAISLRSGVPAGCAVHDEFYKRAYREREH